MSSEGCRKAEIRDGKDVCSTLTKSIPLAVAFSGARSIQFLVSKPDTVVACARQAVCD